MNTGFKQGKFITGFEKIKNIFDHVERNLSPAPNAKKIDLLRAVCIQMVRHTSMEPPFERLSRLWLLTVH